MTTIHDVARRAGVSKSTVSNVVRGRSVVADATRRRVERAIDELGYHPDVVARALRSRATFAIGILVPETVNPFFAVLALGAERAAHAAGYAVLVVTTECEPDREREAVRALIGRRVDGVLVAGASEGSMLHAALLERDVPVVLAGISGMSDARLGVIDVDDDVAMDAVAAHLAALGHRQVAFAGNVLHEMAGERRRLAFAAAASRQGLELVGIEDAPTAIAAHNDMIAIGEIDRLERAGWRVPADVSVVGFDDIPLAAHRRIDLTTVRADGRALGRRATELLVTAAAAGRHVAHTELFDAVLVVRGSTGAVAA